MGDSSEREALPLTSSPWKRRGHWGPHSTPWGLSLELPTPARDREPTADEDVRPSDKTRLRREQPPAPQPTPPREVDFRILLPSPTQQQQQPQPSLTLLSAPHEGRALRGFPSASLRRCGN